MSKVTAHFTESEKSRLDVFLASVTGRSRAFAQNQIFGGRVFINGKAANRPSQLIKSGDAIEADIEETAPHSELKPVESELDILFEDAFLLVLNKPQGLVIHPAPGTLGSTLVHHLLHYLQNTPYFSELSPTRPGIVHRLDRGTSGVLLVAKTDKAHEALSRQFHDREIKKRYEAITWGVPKESGIVESIMARSRHDRTQMTSRTDRGKPALTAWRRLATYGDFSHVELFPKTGRTHQLRVHLTDLGHPIVGDKTYKKSDYFRKVPSLSDSIQSYVQNTIFPFLHSEAIEFTHPETQQKILIRAPRPQRFNEFLQELKTCKTSLN